MWMARMILPACAVEALPCPLATDMGRVFIRNCARWCEALGKVRGSKLSAICVSFFTTVLHSRAS